LNALEVFANRQLVVEMFQLDSREAQRDDIDELRVCICKECARVGLECG
jgi:hypothetical protein